jgi:type II secretory pathway pseudopilin PulG
MTIIMIIAAYTVPRQWSAILQRDRERQTIFIMKQYAIAIDEFERRNKILPVSPNQLKEAKKPRFLRAHKGEYIDPLTGEVDWLVIPQSAAGAGGRPGPGTQPGQGPSGPKPAAAVPGIPMKDYAGGPFIGIRPPKNGDSLISFNGAQRYEQWSYTVLDYKNEREALRAAAQKIWH